MGGTGLQLCIDPEDLGTLALIIYLAALRLTLAPVLGGSAAPSPKEELLHLLHDHLLVLAIRCVLPETRSRPTARWWVRINSTRVRS